MKSQLETSHQDELNELTASFLAETAIKVETTRLETENEWQEKLHEMKEKHELELQTVTEKLKQVSDKVSLFFLFSVLRFYSRFHFKYQFICNRIPCMA